MTETLTVLLTAAGAVAAMLAVLLPVALLQGKSLRREINLQTGNLASALAEVSADLRAELAEVRAGARADLADLRRDLTARMDSMSADLAEVRRDLITLGARVARIEGALTGPWRPNGNPAPAPGASQHRDVLVTLPQTTGRP